LFYGYTFPAVVKVGSAYAAYAGAGKMKISDHHQMSDFRSVLMTMMRIASSSTRLRFVARLSKL
jgi:hypothetical protein